MLTQYNSDRTSHLAAVGLSSCKVNHDLRNILACVQLVSDQLSQLEEPTVQRLALKQAASLDRAMALCSTIINDGQPHDVVPKRQRMALAPLVDEVANSLDLINHRRIDWVNTVAANIEIDADPLHLYRVLLNLCHNAMASLDEAGLRFKEIRVAAKRDGSDCIIEVRDTGIGVPKNAQTHLFGMFQGSARLNGSGLGLVIASELVRAHGGDICLVHGLAKGACFRFSIPDRPAEAEIGTDASCALAAGRELDFE